MIAEIKILTEYVNCNGPHGHGNSVKTQIHKHSINHHNLNIKIMYSLQTSLLLY